MMSELAFNGSGESFELPASATAWRVRRMKPRGAPELVYGLDGRPLSLPIDAEIDDLREAVDAGGKYRLDALNEDGKCIEDVPAAYVHVTKAAREPEATAIPATACATEETLREAMRLNTALAKSVIDRFPEMMQASAELLRAADGAGLPARMPGVPDVDDDAPNADEGTQPAPQGFDVNAIVGQVVTTLVGGLVNGSIKVPSLAGMLDWRKANAELPAVREPKRTESKKPAAKETTLPTLDPATMAHFVAIQSALTPEEATLARAVAADLAPAELRAWFDELSTLSVADAVAKIRGQIAGAKGGVS